MSKESKLSPEEAKAKEWAKKNSHKNKWMPVMYVTYYGILKDIAFSCGYALAVHGSVVRDFDLIAIPWIENPETPDVLIQKFRKKIGGRIIGEPTKKPHGRMAYTIGSGAGGFMDIGIMELKE